MYGIPNDLDLSFLRGRMLDQVCIGSYQILLQLDEDVAIAIEGKFGVARDVPAGSERFTASSRCTAGIALLVELIGETVRDVTIGRDDDQAMIALDFGSLILLIYDSNESFESFNVTAPGRYIVV